MIKLNSILKKSINLALIGGLVITFTSCSSKKAASQEYGQPAIYWYNKITKEIAFGDLEAADDTYISLESEHKNSPLLPTALQILANAHIDKEDITGKNIIFCVKPYALQSVALRLDGQAQLFISILAGTKIESLRKHVSSRYYIRTMPNIAASTLKSMTTITGDKEVKTIAAEIFNSIGKTLWVNTEAQLDIATAVAGSGPAFLALVAEGIIDGAVKAGLERHYSAYLVQGLFESVSSLLEHNHPAIIKDSVTSPGGTTAAGCAVLEDDGVRSAMIKAIEQAHNKAIELSKK